MEQNDTNLNSIEKSKTVGGRFFKWLFVIFLIVILGLGGYYYYQNYNRCGLPIKYSIGNVDSRFKLSENDISAVAKDAVSRWNEATGKNILEYDPQSPMSINLIYDQRQADLDKLKNDLAILENTNKSLTDWSSELDGMIESYQADLKNYDSKLDKYNTDVSYWNGQGGAPKNIFNDLNKVKAELAQESAQLESRRLNINKLANLLDSKASDYNSSVELLKQHLDQNKNKIITQGLYYLNEKKIEIFTFGDQEELRLVLMHELGHAMGLDHDRENNSIMFELLGSQDLKNPTPTDEDEALLIRTCKTDKKMINIPFINQLFRTLGFGI